MKTIDGMGGDAFRAIAAGDRVEVSGARSMSGTVTTAARPNGGRWVIVVTADDGERWEISIRKDA